MRPIVKAVGLICILAHDYLIVKMKMLFRYPVTVIDNQLSVDAAPVLTAASPFFRDVLHSQIYSSVDSPSRSARDCIL